ncbi:MULTISPECIES: virulence protein RhuM/Fic/DOC family protein [Pontibacter]|uniref:Fic/DOC family protein n=1 Tax=Pontibacter lucknowensis TaxID=1077936 RepID=A0A1N6ZWE8_9BACT|nr:MULTISPECIES: virulence protein RhuM/Fic/DOC family protein [Pontibacter]EJF10373.1 filamentation induced by cAMP protein fic [Pontibacter sp. BAB1700]SIR31111.1 Fic/DOC family protein [Pontibacter lucknowensis]
MNEIPGIGEIFIYETESGQSTIDVKLQQETVWLTQKEMARLFEKGRATITEHIRNVFNEGELDEKQVCRKFRHTAEDGKSYLTTYYNLDVIISVGYRVKSKRGTQFRIWATNILRKHLVEGYTLNEKRLKEQAQKYNDLKQTVKLLQNVIQRKELSTDESTGLLQIISDYTYALDILDDYDHQRLAIQGTHKTEYFRITYDSAIAAIRTLKEKFGGSDLFGREKDESFQSSVNTIYQTFGNEELYPSMEEKAANLLYFVVKNHSFSDGNKRIAAFLFVWFMEKNQLLYTAYGQKRIADNALVALTLLIAESDPTEKDMMIKVVVNLINQSN